MNDIITVAVITGAITLLNGPLIITIMSRRWHKDDEISNLREDIDKLFKLVNRLAAGLEIGLRNDKVIFRALRENCINGDSELQDKIMDEYFTECTVHGFKADKGE
ncbi:MAG: hypothetical protein PHR10_10905 [Sphaerochaetaceae bacterium]|jgi:hypothetical protein|nr:hypothetical protein [Sphaerochaetaceae bacterium]